MSLSSALETSGPWFSFESGGGGRFSLLVLFFKISPLGFDTLSSSTYSLPIIAILPVDLTMCYMQMEITEVKKKEKVMLKTLTSVPPNISTKTQDKHVRSTTWPRTHLTLCLVGTLVMFVGTLVSVFNIIGGGKKRILHSLQNRIK